MTLDFKKYFDEYEEIVKQVNNAFEQVKNKYPECHKCKTGCSDCCHAVFDIGLVESLYINHHFHRQIDGAHKDIITEKANKADRAAYKLKRQAFKEFKDGKKAEEEILAEMALHRIRCPLLNDMDMCDLYDHRPITCRLYGIPIAIAGMSHTCGTSGFKEKEQYPTVKLDILQQKLYELACRMIKEIGSRHVKMPEMLIPVSMSLLTDYNEETLGMKKPKAEKEGGEKTN